MTTQQTDRLGEIDIAISKLRVPIRVLLPTLADELEAVKDELSSGYGEFNQKGELEYHPDHKVMSLVGMAALLAARYDVVSKGEGVELMGLWYELDTNESDTDELDTDQSDTDGLEAGELKEWRAAVAFHAMMKRMRCPGWAEIKTLEECLQGVESSLLADLTEDGAVPEWNSGIGVLSLGGLLVKKYRQPAKNQRMILDAFQEEGWPQRVNDPLHGVHAADPKQRLNETVRALNENRKSDALHFEADGTGEGVIWSKSK